MTITEVPTGQVVRSRPRACLHHAAPVTPFGVFSRFPSLLMAAIAGLLLLAIGAAVAGSAALSLWDEPIQRAVEARRTADLDTFFRAASRFGSTEIVLVGGALFACVAALRCPAVAVAVIAATAGRPPLEWLLKDVTARARPDFSRMVDGTGYSFPSGHVMAAVALWGLLPVVVGLYTRRRSVWWTSVGVAAAMIGAIAASRVYLGVHWFSDIVGGLLFGSIFLLGVELVLRRAHNYISCRVATPSA
jgi:undecaprenyl-diphosphatase